MPDPVTAVVGTAVGGSLVQADAQRSASNKAAGAASAAADKNNALYEQNYERTQALLNPYITSGQVGLDTFMALGGFYNPATGSIPRTYSEYTKGISERNAAAQAEYDKQVAAQRQPMQPQQYMDYNRIGVLNKANPLGNILKNTPFKGVGGLKEAMGRSNEEIQRLAQMGQPAAIAEAQRRQLSQPMQYQQGGQPQLQAPTAEQAMTEQQFYDQQRQLADNAQRREIQSIEQSPLYMQLVRQGEDAIAQNASATGGLRGGNTQGALLQYRPSMLKSLIDQKMQNALGLQNTGMNAAGALANTGMNTVQQQAGQNTNAGQAQADNFMNQANITTGLVNNISSAVGFGAGNIGGGVKAPQYQPTTFAPMTNSGIVNGTSFGSGFKF